MCRRLLEGSGDVVAHLDPAGRHLYVLPLRGDRGLPGLVRRLTLAVVTLAAGPAAWPADFGHAFTLKGQGEEVRALAVAPDGTTVATAGGEGPVRLWDAHSGEFRRQTRPGMFACAVAFSPDSRRLALGGAKGLACVLDATSLSPQANLALGSAEPIASLAFSADGTWLALASAHRVAVRRVADGQETWASGVENGTAVAFSPDGQTLAVAGGTAYQGCVFFHDAATGKETKGLVSGHTKVVRAIAYSPDGTLFACGGSDPFLSVWDVRRGTCLYRLPVRSGVYAVAVAPVGSPVASGDSSGNILLWDPRTGQPVQTLVGHSGTVTGLGFTADGEALVSTGTDKSVRLWRRGHTAAAVDRLASPAEVARDPAPAAPAARVAPDPGPDGTAGRGRAPGLAPRVPPATTMPAERGEARGRAPAAVRQPPTPAAPPPRAATQKDSLASPLPPFRRELSGRNEVRIRNPNSFTVEAGVRAGTGGKDLQVPPNGTRSVHLPNGSYEIYFVYSDRPDALFQGDSFTLANNGVEIQIVKVASGNYGIHQVK